MNQLTLEEVKYHNKTRISLTSGQSLDGVLSLRNVSMLDKLHHFSESPLHQLLNQTAISKLYARNQYKK